MKFECKCKRECLFKVKMPETYLERLDREIKEYQVKKNVRKQKKN